MNYSLQRFFLMTVVVLLTAGCTVKTFYNQLDWLLANHIESYVELDDEQYQMLYQRIDQFFNWHKSTQLPVYVEWLQDFNRDVQDRPSREGIEQNFEQFKLLLRALRAHAAREVVPLLEQLSPAQKKELIQGMERKNQEFAEKFIQISREEQLEQYYERTADRIKEWLGTLTESQKKRIHESAIQIKPVAKLVLESRRKWQSAFYQVLASHPPGQQFQAAVDDLFINIEKRRTSQYQALSRHNQDQFVQLIVDIAKDMTADQRQHLQSKVDNYSYHFTALAKEARNQASRTSF